MAGQAPSRLVARAIAGHWHGGNRAQRWLFAVGSLLVLVGLAHLLPAVVSDHPWQGPVSFRKPILFGFSFGLTCVTLAWILSYLRVGKRAAWTLAVMIGGSSVVEVGAVSLQAFRGVPSHFNVTTGPFNAGVFGLMGVAVTFIAAAVLLATVWSFTRLDAPSPLTLGIRAGLVLLLVSQALGGQMIAHGLEQVAGQTGQEPNIFGAAGQLKVPHALTVHAAQVLPGIAWLLGFSSVPTRLSTRITAMAVTGYASLTAVAALQTFSGRAPVDLLPASGVLLLLAVALLASSGVAALASLARRPRSTPADVPPMDVDSPAGVGRS